MKHLRVLLALVLCSCSSTVTVGNGYKCTEYVNKQTKTRKVILEETKPNGFDHLNQFIKNVQ